MRNHAIHCTQTDPPLGFKQISGFLSTGYTGKLDPLGCLRYRASWAELHRGTSVHTDLLLQSPSHMFLSFPVGRQNHPSDISSICFPSRLCKARAHSSHQHCLFPAGCRELLCSPNHPLTTVIIACTPRAPPLLQETAILQLQVVFTVGEELKSLFCQVQEMWTILCIPSSQWVCRLLNQEDKNNPPC